MLSTLKSDTFANSWHENHLNCAEVTPRTPSVAGCAHRCWSCHLHHLIILAGCWPHSSINICQTPEPQGTFTSRWERQMHYGTHTESGLVCVKGLLFEILSGYRPHPVSDHQRLLLTQVCFALSNWRYVAAILSEHTDGFVQVLERTQTVGPHRGFEKQRHSYSRYTRTQAFKHIGKRLIFRARLR